MKKKWLLKCLIIIAVYLFAVVGLYIYDKNLFPVRNVTLERGIYRYIGDGEGEIVATGDYVLRIQNFDLNSKVKGSYYKQDLNAVFLNKNIEFTLKKGMTGCYSLLYSFPDGDGEFLEIEYYPREDRLKLLTANESKTYIFELENN